MAEAPALSVVVATRNRVASVERLLARLGEQPGAPPFEVIVADNGSTDETPLLARRAVAGFTLRYVRVDQPGKGRAVNAALRVAAGALVVFTDDDVVPDARWLAEVGAAAERHPDAVVFGGMIRVATDGVPSWIRRSRNLMALLTSEHDGRDAGPVYPYGGYPFGPNMAVRRSALLAFPDPYPENLGPGTRLPVGDEGAFLARISPPDARDRVYVPSAIVVHDVEASNLTFGAAVRRSYAQGKAQARVRIAVVPPSSAGAACPFVQLVIARIRASTSVREFLCTCVRHAGYVVERGRG